MAKQTVNNGESGLIVRGKINDNFTELYNRSIYVEDYGAVGDGTTDDTSAIQAAIDAAIASTSIHTVRFMAKNYKITGPLICCKLSAGAYVTFNLNLIGDVNANAGVGTRCTQITCTHKDTFAIGIQNGRSCTIQNLLITGAYSYTKTFKEIAEGDVNDWAATGVRDERYSPYAGITIDPFGTSIQADGGYPGLSSYYKASAAGSSGISVRDCYITNFVVGYSISNNGTTPNAESINIYNTRIYNTKIAWSSGQSQTRACAMNDCAVFSCLTAIDTEIYGDSLGSAPVVNNLIVSKVKNIVNISINRAVFSASDIYAEETWKIGVITGDKIANFRNCTFKLNYGNNSDYVKGPDTYLGGGGEASFYSCDFTKSGDQTYNAIFSNITASFYNCNFESLNPPYSTSNALNFYDCTFAGKKLTQGQRYVGTSTGYLSYNGVNLKKSLPGVTTQIMHNILPSGNSIANIGSVSITVVSNSTATFTPSSVTTIKVGDIIYATAPLPYNFYFQDLTQNNDSTVTSNTAPILGTVSNINAGVVTIKDIPYNLVDGTFTIANQWGDIYYGGIFGTTTSGSNVITNVYKESSNSLVGTRIFSADPSQFTTGLYVVSEDTNARTLTLSGNLGTSKSSIGLYTAYFVYDIVTTAAPSGITGLYADQSAIIKTRGAVLSDKAYFVSTGGIVGNATHVPAFKTLDMT